MKKIFLLFFVLYILFSNPFKAEAAASLYLSPSTGTYTVGNTFLVQVKVNSGGVAINAADGTLVFNPNDLEVRSISKENSVFSLWVQEPTFSNSLGTINFAGGKPSPGFVGAAGTIFNITFKARTSGAANVSFASGSILADDGKGTNILANMGAGSYQLTGREIAPIPPPTGEEYPTAPTPTGQTPAAPIVSSPTHSDENKWYSNDNPEFSWKLPLDVSGVSLMLNEKPTSNPGSVSDGLIESKKYENIEDGVWYFHIKFRNQYGWGKITHRKVLIDTALPEPFKIVVDKKDLIDPSPILYFETTDALSGVEYYEVKIGDGEAIKTTLADLKRNPFQLPAQAPGRYSIEVKAFDKAENYTSSFTEIEILAIETPTIIKFPKRLNLGEGLTLEGESLPEVTILVFIQEKGKEPAMEEISADGEGKWAFTSKPLEKGSYDAWVQAKDKRGALSLPSSKLSFEVGLPPLLKFGTIAISYLTIMLTLIVLIAVAIVIIFYTWYRISIWRKRLRTETKEVTQAVYNAFKALQEEVQEQTEYLDGKPGLTPGEKKVRDKLKEALNISEEFISKELKDVERELE